MVLNDSILSKSICFNVHRRSYKWCIEACIFVLSDGKVCSCHYKYGLLKESKDFTREWTYLLVGISNSNLTAFAIFMFVCVSICMCMCVSVQVLLWYEFGRCSFVYIYTCKTKLMCVNMLHIYVNEDILYLYVCIEISNHMFLYKKLHKYISKYLQINFVYV